MTLAQALFAPLPPIAMVCACLAALIAGVTCTLRWVGRPDFGWRIASVVAAIWLATGALKIAIHLSR